MPKDTRFTIRTGSDFHQLISEKARREGLTISALILGLLAAWLAGKAAPLSN